MLRPSISASRLVLITKGCTKGSCHHVSQTLKKCSMLSDCRAQNPFNINANNQNRLTENL